MTTSTEQRDEQVGAFFATHGDRLRRAVRHSVRAVGDEVIEDASQVAWITLLRRDDVTLDARGFRWLVTVAVREAWRLGSTVREQPAGIFAFDAEREPGELPEPADTEHRSTVTKALDQIEHAERLQALHVLKPAEREALFLKGLGYSYTEIMRLTGATYTAVNRRLTEGRAALREQLDDDTVPRRP